MPRRLINPPTHDDHIYHPPARIGRYRLVVFTTPKTASSMTAVFTLLSVLAAMAAIAWAFRFVLNDINE